MKFYNITKIDTDLKLKLESFYSNSENVSIHQHPSFPLNNKKINKRCFVLEDDNEIKAYCFSSESKLSKLPFIQLSKINFGPISISNEFSKLLMDNITQYYKKSFTELIIDPLINDQLLIKEVEIKKSNKGTLLIDLKKELSEIENDFSTILKKNLKRGYKLPMLIEPITSKTEIEDFSEVYMKMSASRGLNHYSKDEIMQIVEFVVKTDSGIALSCHYEDKLIGGVVCIRQGNRMEYYLGFTDPEYRKLPQSHLTLFESIKTSKNKGIEIFDMGGIIFDANENDQLFHVSNFKRHFSKNEIRFNSETTIKFNSFKSLLKKVYYKLA